MSKITTIFINTILAVLLTAWASQGLTETRPAWRPDKPVQIVVPWSAGGATDAVVRILSREVSRALGVPVVVVNQTGARGTVGTKSVMDAPPDGYTWLSGSAQDLGTYQVQGLLDTHIEDWHVFLVLKNMPVLSVGVQTPFESPLDVARQMRTAEQITVATSGIPSTAYMAMQAFKETVGGNFRAVTYPGDAPSMVAVVSGEVQATTQSGPGQAAMIRGRRVRPLAVLADSSLHIAGADPIPSVKQFYPEFDAPGVTILVGVFLPKATPPEVIDRLETIWASDIANSEALRDYATRNGSILTPVYGEQAMEMARQAVIETAWRMHNIGVTAVTPDEVGIPRP